MPLPLAPNERLTGTPEQRRSLCAHLSTLRTGPAACHRHPHLSFTALADLLASPPRYFDPDVLAAGLAITRERLRDSGLTSLLPSGEAQAITRRTADLTGITPPPGHPARAAFHDATGQLATASGPIAVGAPPVSLPAFLARMDAYHRTVTAPYTAFLSEISPRDPAALHDAILAAIITGSLASLNTALNQIHGPAAFTRLFHANPCTTTRAAV